MARVKKFKKPWDIRVWPTWILVAFMWLIVRLPYPALVGMARGLGGIVYHFGRSRRHITDTNLALCFPELQISERNRLARESFTHTAIGVLEAAMVWLNPGRDIAARTHLHDVEQLLAASAEGRGVVLVGGHFSAMDVLGPKMAEIDIDVMYRWNRRPVWEWLQVMGRGRYFGAVIERQDTRQTLRRLKAGRTIWYAADQDYGKRHSVFARFFGIPTATINGTARLAAFNDSAVLFASHFRDLQTGTWNVYFSERIEDFPSADPIADAERINSYIEAAIRKHPEQYLWMHRRFKTRPDGEPALY